MSRSMLPQLLRALVWLGTLGFLATMGWFTQSYWKPLLGYSQPEDHDHAETSVPPVADSPRVLKLAKQARQNLNLKVRPLEVTHYWQSLRIPGIIQDRPGFTDRGVTSPLAGVVTEVYAFQGDIVRPGQRLFQIRLVSDYLQKTQTELFRAIREVEVFEQEIARISDLADAGTIPGKRKLELQQQISRQKAIIEANRQDLLSRGVAAEQIAAIETGTFLTTTTVTAPVMNPDSPQVSGDTFFEVQELKVELGQQVDSGELLALIADHRALYIRGYAFKNDASAIARAAEQGWELEVAFSDDSSEQWPSSNQKLIIRNLANTTDPATRTFDFFIALTNQSRTYQRDGQKFVIWRYRPGQRVTIKVPTVRMDNVVVMPAEGVAIEGPEAYVFQQNGNLFNRIPVRVLHQDQDHVIIANDDSLSPGFFLAQNAAASLNRVLKAQAASGMRADVHVHADGTVHAAH